MYRVLGSCMNDGQTTYMVQDLSGGEPEFISANDLGMLLFMGVDMSTEAGKVSYSDGNIIGDIPDFTAATNSYQDEDEYDWSDDDYEEDEESFDTEYVEDEDDAYYWDDEEEEDIEDPEEPYDYDEDYDDYDEDEIDLDEYGEFYYNWKANAGSTDGYGQNDITMEQAEKDFSDLEESTESKLYSYLTDEQKHLLQEYYLYISKRVFNLERGVNNLPIKRKADLDGIRNTGDSWVYAGFIDMGYAGTSVCPFCRSPLGMTALSSCHKAPVVRWAEPRGKVAKMQGKGRYLARTHNGTCTYPGCKARCSVVTDNVGIREINRSNQSGIVCEKCGNNIPQSTHYCTFNDPVRYMHIAWDVTVSDLDVQFYGQFGSAEIEELINTNNCIKFGLSCTAEFFDIAKDSAAFEALEHVQNTCKKDMELLQADYEAGKADFINSKFGLLDSLVPKLRVYAAKKAMISDDVRLPVRILELYTKMRSEGMIIPKSMIQFIRDFIVDWQTHKFIDRSKAFPDLFGSIGSLAGAKTNTRAEVDCYTRMSELIVGLWGSRKAGAMAALIEKYKDRNERRNLRYYNNGRVQGACFDYLVAFFIYKICGYYEYDAVNNGDEGGKDQDKSGYGKHSQELKGFYRNISYTIGNLDYSIDNLMKVFKIVELVYRIEEARKFQPMNIALWYELDEDGDKQYRLYERGKDFTSDHRTLVKAYTEYDDKLAGIIDGNLLNRIESYDIKGKIDSWISSKEELASYIEGVVKAYPDFEREYMQKKLEEYRGSVVKKQSVNTPDSNTSEKAAGTVDEVMTYLLQQDTSKITERRFDFHLKLLEDLRTRGKTPTDRQFYYMKMLYEHISGQKYTGGSSTQSAELTDDDVKAIDYVLGKKNSVDDFTLQVLKTIKRYNKASDKQKKYLDKAIEVYKNSL